MAAIMYHVTSCKAVAIICKETPWHNDFYPYIHSMSNVKPTHRYALNMRSIQDVSFIADCKTYTSLTAQQTPNPYFSVFCPV